MTRSVVLGIGNLLLTDDGAGVHAARRLAALLVRHTQVSVLDAGTLSFTLAPLVESADHLIVLDAAQLNLPSGSVQCFIGDQFDEFLGRARLSVHEIGLRDIMDVTRLAGALPPKRTLIGIQPESLDWGLQLTPPVAEGLGPMIAKALEFLEMPKAIP